MASFNKVTLIGNLTRDVQLKYLPSQTAVAEFGIAINRKFKTADGEDREEVVFVDITSFDKQAEVLNQYMSKGKLIFIEGRLKFDQWDDKQGGGKRSKLTVICENFQFLGSREGGDQPARRDDDDQRRDNYPRNRQTVKAGGPPEPPFSEEQQFKDDDIPF